MITSIHIHTFWPYVNIFTSNLMLYNFGNWKWSRIFVHSLEMHLLVISLNVHLLRMCVNKYSLGMGVSESRTASLIQPSDVFKRGLCFALFILNLFDMKSVDNLRVKWYGHIVWADLYEAVVSALVTVECADDKCFNWCLVCFQLVADE
jgi:hypothetical protein